MDLERYKQEFLRHILSLNGVEFAHLTFNTGWVWDYDRGLSPHSFRLCVKGGDEKEIAKAIWYQRPLGIKTCGSVKVKIKDSFGFKHKVYFERVW